MVQVEARVQASERNTPRLVRHTPNPDTHIAEIKAYHPHAKGLTRFAEEANNSVKDGSLSLQTALELYYRRCDVVTAGRAREVVIGLITQCLGIEKVGKSQLEIQAEIAEKIKK